MPVPNIIVLVHSDETKIFADKLNNEFKNFTSIQYIDLGNKEDDPKCIKDELINFLKSKSDISSIHLNFTGGKKTMAVYSYMAVYDYANKHHIQAIFSYLDPDKRCLVLQDGRRFPAAMHDLRDDVLLNIQTVLKLHNMIVMNSGVEKPLYEGLMNKNQFDEFVKMAVKKYYQNDRSYKDCVNDICNFMRRKDIRQHWRISGKADQIIRKANDESLFLPFESISILLFSRYLPGGYYNTGEKDNFYDFCEFIAGKWLEDFVLVTLQRLNKDGDIQVEEIKKGIEAHYAGRKTEIDVIVIKGYEMFLISCTTSQEIRFVKQKAFEALYRAEQLGGEHAKVIVVSLMYNQANRYNQFRQENNLEELKKDLSQFDAARNAAENLIGINEIRKEVGLIRSGLSLSERLKNIIEG